MYSVIAVTNLDTMNMNAERNGQINTEEIIISPTMKENPLNPCFFPAMFLETITLRTFVVGKLIQLPYER